MEFLDEYDESRPRFQLQTRVSSSSLSKPQPPHQVNKIQALLCASIAALLLSISLFYLSHSQLLQLLLVWISLSLALGPFAPPSLTGGDISVGRGHPLPPSDPDPSFPLDDPRKRRPKPRRPDDPSPSPEAPDPKPRIPISCNRSARSPPQIQEKVEQEWTEEDLDLLKKQIAKHPSGAPRRWEAIAEAFRGRHGLESVIGTAKSLAERRPGGGDSFAQFLRQRKPLSRKLDGIDQDSKPPGDGPVRNGDASSDWSAAEDIALLNALKAFPKDALMRWEKIAAAVPGKSKACCMKRVAELKRDFRNSKGSET